MKIRAAVEGDHQALLDIWLRSVRQTHAFLTEQDIQYFLPIVRDQALPGLELWTLIDEYGRSIGFMGLDAHKVEALFIAPEHLRRGGGKKLIEFAQNQKGPLQVDVNEQNPQACRFYEALGFVTYDRSEVDSSGRPFPLLHMRQSGAP